MELEPIDEDLEPLLREVIENTDECTGCAEDIDFYTPEYRGLKEAGMFAEFKEFMDGTASVMLTRSALEYFGRKEEWEKSEKKAAIGNVGKKIADTAVDIGTTAAMKLAGL